MDPLLLIAYKRGSRWVLLNDQAMELGQYSAEDEIVQAATTRLQAFRRAGALLMETRDGWREQALSPA